MAKCNQPPSSQQQQQHSSPSPSPSPSPIQNRRHHLPNVKHCKAAANGKHPDHHAPRRALCSSITILLLLAGIVLLVLWFVYRPHKPKFAVVGAAIYALNSTSVPPPPSLLTATLQFTVHIKNPSRRASARYDRLSAFMSYRGEPITAPIMLPPLRQGRRSAVSISPVIGGSPVPVTGEVCAGLAVEEGYGAVGVRVVIQGRVRWKAGIIKTGHYGMHVKCDVMIGLKKGFVGQVPLLANPPCVVDI